MATATPQLFLGVNVSLFIAGVALAIIILTLAARHTWLVGYGPEQARVRAWVALCLILLLGVALGAAAFNLLWF